jgi:hypothetical protein
MPGPWPALLLALLLFLALPIPPSPPASPSLRELLPYPRATREALVALHLSNKASLRLLLGDEAARAYDRLLRLELNNQLSGKRSAFSKPEEALQAARLWVLAIGQASRAQAADLRGLPTAPHHVLPHAQKIRAAGALRIPYGVLAAIVDNEQYGGDKALGLSRGVREVADGLAQGLAELQGQAPLSRALGLAQMSFEDALKQEPRLKRFGAWDPARPFPKTEAEARKALLDPYLNLLFTAKPPAGVLQRPSGPAPRGHPPPRGPLALLPGPRLAQLPLKGPEPGNLGGQLPRLLQGALLPSGLRGALVT